MWTPVALGHGRQVNAVDDDQATWWSIELRAADDRSAVLLSLSAGQAEGVGQAGGSRQATTAGEALPAKGVAGLQVGLRPGEDRSLPPVAESYVRGDDFVVVMPQTAEHRYGLSLQVRVVEANRRRAVAELLIAVQTDLLDSHQRLQLCTPPASVLPPLVQAAGDGEPGQVARLQGADGTAAALFLGGGDGAAAISGPVPTAASASTEALQAAGEPPAACCCLFSEFLEKGVIRKARPWIALWRDEPPDDAELAALLQQRLCSPLPLTT